MIILFSRRSLPERVSLCGAAPIGASGSSIVMDEHSLQNSGCLPFVHKSWQCRENLLNKFKLEVARKAQGVSLTVLAINHREN